MLPNGTQVVVNEGQDDEYTGVVVNNDGSSYTVETATGNVEAPAHTVKPVELVG
jgi:ribosomal protein L21E